MISGRKYPFVAAITCCCIAILLLACSRTYNVHLRVPVDYRGPLIRSEDPNSAKAWTVEGDNLSVQVVIPHTKLNKLLIHGHWLTVEVVEPNGSRYSEIPSVDTRDAEKVALRGGIGTPEGEIHYYLGTRAAAVEYFDRLRGTRR